MIQSDFFSDDTAEFLSLLKEALLTPKSFYTENDAQGPSDLQGAKLASYIDHTLLKPGATSAEILALCMDAQGFQFSSVCVHSSYVAMCAKILANTEVSVCSVVGFPLGAMATSAKVFEAQFAVQKGAREIDMVIHLGALKAKDYAYVLQDIRSVVEASSPAIVKVILETSELSHDEKVAGALLAKLAKAHFVKTSTGFGKGGATVEDVALLRSIVGSELGVKASGGIRNFEEAKKMIRAGASRLGTSASIAIVTEASVHVAREDESSHGVLY